MTKKMTNRDTGVCADVHDDEVENWANTGWVLSDETHEIEQVADDLPLAENDADAGQFSDSELRDIIKENTGEAPHHKTGREKLEKQFTDLKG